MVDAIVPVACHRMIPDIAFFVPNVTRISTIRCPRSGNMASLNGFTDCIHRLPSRPLPRTNGLWLRTNRDFPFVIRTVVRTRSVATANCRRFEPIFCRRPIQRHRLSGKMGLLVRLPHAKLAVCKLLSAITGEHGRQFD